MDLLCQEVFTKLRFSLGYAMKGACMNQLKIAGVAGVPITASNGIEVRRASSRRSFVSSLLLMLFVFSFVFAGSAKAEIKVGLVLDKGGKDDRSFNASAFAGASRAKEKLKATLKYVEATDDSAFEPMLRALAQKKFDIIFAIGVSQVDSVKKVAAQFPDQKFAIVDGIVDAPNVRSIIFEEHEGSFIVGALAAMASKSSTVGFIGGMDIPLIRRFEKGYEAGVKAVKPQAKVLINFVGMTSDAWNNPARAKELAVTQYNGGADVIFAAAGASGTGLFDAAEEKGKFAIGVDSNQNWVKPGRVLTSMVKKIDEAVFAACEEVNAGKFKGGTLRFGLASKGVDYSLDQYNDALVTPEMRKKLEELKQKVIAGKVKVPDYYLMNKK